MWTALSSSEHVALKGSFKHGSDLLIPQNTALASSATISFQDEFLQGARIIEFLS
jgi:hypothetical protein